MIAITWARLADGSLLARMDVAARALTYTGAFDTGLKPDESVAKGVLDPATNFRFWPLPGDSKATADNRKAEFIHAVEALSKLDEKKLDFSKKFDELDPLSMAFSDSQPIGRPSLMGRLGLSYYTIDGVHFRRLDDLSRVRDLAGHYLDFRARHNVPTGLDEIFRPWSIFEFYDPKRGELDDFLPVVFTLLMLVVRFLLAYRYYDVNGTRIGQQIYLTKKQNNWIPLWKTPVIDGHEMMVSRGMFWPILLSISALVGVLIELLLNDPEVWPERLLNIPMMAATCCLAACLLVCLVSLSASAFSENFRGQRLKFRGRILLPLVITLGPGVFAITFWVSLFSWRRLSATGYSAMQTRGWIQLAICAALELLAIFTLWRIFDRAPGTGPIQPDDPASNPSEPGCLARVGISTDEKLIVSIALVLIPWAKALMW